MDREYAQYLLDKTRQDYNLIAEDFSRTRRYIWDNFRPLAEYIKPGNKVLDLGCGNGRLFDILGNKKINYVGVDNSQNLIKIAKEKYPGIDFRVADALNLPLSDNYFDEIYSIAVLHHIPSKELRSKFLREAKRVLKPNGLLILTVWDLKRLGLTFKFTVLKAFGRSKLDFKDVLVSWGKSCQRYIHCFSQKELEQLVKKAGFKIKEVGTLKMSEGKENNIYIVAQK